MPNETLKEINTELLDEGVVKFTIPADLLKACRPSITVTEMEDVIDHHKTYVVQLFLEEITGPINITEKEIDV